MITSLVYFLSAVIVGLTLAVIITLVLGMVG
jgi:hypothetical protein